MRRWTRSIAFIRTGDVSGSKKRLRFAIPKGSLEKDTFELLNKAFYEVRGQERTYRPLINDPDIELKVLRPQEIPVYVAEGLHDIGITGNDWIDETDASVEVLRDLEYGKVRLVVAAPADKGYRSLSDLLEEHLSNGRPIRISTEYVNITRRYLMSNETYKRYVGDEPPVVITPWFRTNGNASVTIFLSFGATEAKPPEEADVIVDNTATGLTLEQNNLKVLEVIMESSATLVANRSSMKDPWKREKILDVLTMLTGVIESRKKVHVFLNVREENLQELLATLPALKSPTINKLASEGWYAVNTVMEKNELLRLLPKLRKISQGLVAHEPQLILPLEEISQTDKGLEEVR